MDGEERFAGQAFTERSIDTDYPPDLCARFVAPDFQRLPDAALRQERIARLVAGEIVPRLSALHAAVDVTRHPTSADITELARLVLSPDAREAASHVTALRDGGLTVEVLFAELLEPAARRLGELWNSDEIDFLDVTLGVGRLQALLSVFNDTLALAPLSTLRSIVMLTVPGEQHSFGIAMVERFLEAGGWQVTSEREASDDVIGDLVGRDWFAVAGITVSNTDNLPKVAAAIATIRARSLNRRIGVIVGGPPFSASPELARTVGADGTATSAPAAVVLAQKLLDAAIAAQAQGIPARNGALPA